MFARCSKQTNEMHTTDYCDHSAAAANIAAANLESAEGQKAKSPLQGCRGARLKVNRAFHSPAMAGPAATLQEYLANHEGNVHHRLLFPVTSNVTGGWIEKQKYSKCMSLSVPHRW